MADLLGRAAEFLDDQRHLHMTRTVVYRRGATSGSVQATRGRSFTDVDDGAGAALRFENVDWIIRVADIDSLLSSEPQRGDKIEWTVGEAVYIYEVREAGGGVWAYADDCNLSYRLHTAFVDETTI